MGRTQQKTPSWLTKFFEPKTDFYALLKAQANTTLQGMVAFEEWLNDGASGRCQIVRDLEKEADELRLDLERKLVEAFVTPFDREDIYDLSARLDEVINAAKTTAREIEALDIVTKDAFLREMAAILVEGTRCLTQSISNLNGNLAEASDQATLARKSENRFARTYMQAMRELFALDDMKTILKTREVYRCLVIAAGRIDVVGEKLLHAIVKMN